MYFVSPTGFGWWGFSVVLLQTQPEFVMAGSVACIEA